LPNYQTAVGGQAGNAWPIYLLQDRLCSQGLRAYGMLQAAILALWRRASEVPRPRYRHQACAVAHACRHKSWQRARSVAGPWLLVVPGGTLCGPIPTAWTRWSRRALCAGQLEPWDCSSREPPAGHRCRGRERWFRHLETRGGGRCGLDIHSSRRRLTIRAASRQHAPAWLVVAAYVHSEQ